MVHKRPPRKRPIVLPPPSSTRRWGVFLTKKPKHGGLSRRLSRHVRSSDAGLRRSLHGRRCSNHRDGRSKTWRTKMLRPPEKNVMHTNKFDGTGKRANFAQFPVKKRSKITLTSSTQLIRRLHHLHGVSQASDHARFGIGGAVSMKRVFYRFPACQGTYGPFMVLDLR